MFKAAAMLYIYVDSPLHAGSGRGVGAVDLPLQRERVTGYPMVQASGIKGALREDTRVREEKISGADAARTKIRLVFGPDMDDMKNELDHAGAISPGDARLLLFPVRSLAGVFAWTTSVDALRRFCRDMDALGKTLDWDVPTQGPNENEAWVTSQANVIAAANKVVLEEFSFDANKGQAGWLDTAATWLAANALPKNPQYKYWQDKLSKSLVVLANETFRDFTVMSTEVVTRIKLNSKTKTVDKDAGALWTEESLPVDTLLYAPLYAAHPRSNANGSGIDSAESALKFVSGQFANKTRIQLGGDETVGRGAVSLRFGEMQSLV